MTTTCEVAKLSTSGHKRQRRQPRGAVPTFGAPRARPKAAAKAAAAAPGAIAAAASAAPASDAAPLADVEPDAEAEADPEDVEPEAEAEADPESSESEPPVWGHMGDDSSDAAYMSDHSNPFWDEESSDDGDDGRSSSSAEASDGVAGGGAASSQEATAVPPPAPPPASPEAHEDVVGSLLDDDIPEVFDTTCPGEEAPMAPAAGDAVHSGDLALGIEGSGLEAPIATRVGLEDETCLGDEAPSADVAPGSAGSRLGAPSTPGAGPAPVTPLQAPVDVAGPPDGEVGGSEPSSSSEAESRGNSSSADEGLDGVPGVPDPPEALRLRAGWSYFSAFGSFIVYDAPHGSHLNAHCTAHPRCHWDKVTHPSDRRGRKGQGRPLGAFSMWLDLASECTRAEHQDMKRWVASRAARKDRIRYRQMLKEHLGSEDLFALEAQIDGEPEEPKTIPM